MFWAKRTGWIGVDIGTHAVKLAQVERRGSRLELTEAAIVSRRHAWDLDRQIDARPGQSDEEIVAGRSLGAGFRGRQAACSLPMSVCDLRSVSIASGAAPAAREAVAHELESIHGRRASGYEFDFWPVQRLGRGPARDMEDVNVVSVSRDWAYRIAHDAANSGFSCQVLDVLPMALARAVGLVADARPGAVHAAVDWGYSTATFCLVVDGRPAYVRCLRDCGFRSVVAEVAKTLEVTNQEAQQLLSQRGLPEFGARGGDRVQCILDEILAEHLNALIEELNRTLSFTRSQTAGRLPEQLWLFGGGATLRNVAGRLTAAVGVAVQPWSLGRSRFRNSLSAEYPVPLLGPAIALSLLAWTH